MDIEHNSREKFYRFPFGAVTEEQQKDDGCFSYLEHPAFGVIKPCNDAYSQDIGTGDNPDGACCDK